MEQKNKKQTCMSVMCSPLLLLDKGPVIKQWLGKGITVRNVFYTIRVVSKRNMRLVPFGTSCNRLTIYVIFTQKIMFIDVY
jgi:hypothetical protein